ncbi:MAG: TlyA family RNA methyltransferase [Pyrinomonadaceae bacterium MAG19_C2-C3]|nr:TlyA family RNA methyltransferase [Pyrinomonadaceae bacterium MAG19_C2-C3]
MRGERIDKLLVERGLAESRTRAQALVMAGLVLVDERRVEKPSELTDPDAQLRVRGTDDPAFRFVGRGALKLEHALDVWNIDVNGATCLDIGASTGGFTDCLLQRGARGVVAVDVGRNQLAYKLRVDERVEVRESTNARYLHFEDFPSYPNGFDLIVMDVSFISATKILPALVGFLAHEGQLITLIKPQFEVGRGEVGKGGIVTDSKQHERVIAEVNQAATDLGLAVRAVIDSPVTGAEGNKEFLALYVKQESVRQENGKDVDGK